MRKSCAGRGLVNAPSPLLDYPGKDTVVVVVCVCVDPDGQRRVPKGSGRDPVGCVIFRTLSAQDTML